MIAMPDFPDAIDYLVDESRVFIDQNDHWAIVCHGTGAKDPNQTVESLGDWFRTDPAKACTHYGISRDGRIAQYCPEKDGACGNGILEEGYDPFWDQLGGDNPNCHTLSFETMNDEENSLALTDAQKATVFKLIAYWCNKYTIPTDHIKGHFSLQPFNRQRCPGPNFPWDELMNYLTGEDTSMTISLSTPGVDGFFTGNTDIWTCKQNGFLLGHAILAFYQKFGGDALCGLTYLGIPIGNEQPIAKCVYQRFERGVLIYDPNHTIDNPPQSGSVYLAHLTSGVGQDPRIAILQAQLDANQQAQIIQSLDAKIASAIYTLQK